MESGAIVFGAHPDDPEAGCDGLVTKGMKGASKPNTA
jgi:hypothetical protein